MDDTVRMIVYLLWAMGSVFVWGRVLWLEWEAYRALPTTERRRAPEERERLPAVRAAARRELLSDASLFLVGVFAALSLVVLLVSPDVPGIRGFALALALGAFLGAGIFRAFR